MSGRSLASYLPWRLVERLQSGGSSGSGRVEAATLMADLSGFTRHSEDLAARGAEGAELLTSVLNLYFGVLIDDVLDSGGDIVVFAGDAVIAIWPTEGGASLAECVRRATACGVKMQADLAQITDPPGGIRFELRVGIGSGDVSLLDLGGEGGRWTFLAAGSGFQAVGNAEKAAELGDVVVSGEAWSQVEDHFTAAPAADGTMRVTGARPGAPAVDEPVVDPSPPRDPADPAQLVALRGYLPSAVLSRLDAGQTDWLAELRTITTLFINFPSLDPGTEAGGRVLRAAFQAVHAVMDRLEGCINKVLMDEKGTTLVAVFGLPPIGHEDDARRGVRAALDIRGALEELGNPFGVGVTTGRAFCGAYGNDRRREYTMLGSRVNLAARLMAAARDEVLCDRLTHRAAASRFSFEALTPMALKGISEPVPVFRLGDELARGERGDARQTGQVVGRDAELAALAERLDTLLAGGAPGPVLIEGDAGIGKSRLAAWAEARAVAAGARVLGGHGDIVERARPYHPWRDVFDDLLGVAAGKRTAEEARAAILAALADDGLLRSWAPLVEVVVAVGLEESETTGLMSGQARAEATRDVLRRLLSDGASDAPRLVILDDCQWFDSASWALLAAVARGLPGVLLVVLGRPHGSGEPDARWAELRDRGDCAHLVLEPMDEAALTQLACRRLGVAQLPRAVSAFLVERAEGNPFYCEEIAFALKSAGLIVVVDGQCQLAPGLTDLHGAEVPDTLQGVVTGRLDSLTPGEQLSVKVASVIGREFEVPVLRDTHPVAEDARQVEVYLDRLEQLELVHPEPAPPEGAWSFRQGIVQECAYATLMVSQRRRLHRAVAEWYERSPSADDAVLAPLLAHHWDSAGEPARSLDHLVRSGDAALRTGADREAVQHFQRVVQIVDELDRAGGATPPVVEQARWLSALGWAQFALGQLEESKAQLRAAMTRAGFPLPRSNAGWVVRLLVELVRRFSRIVLPGVFVRVARPPRQQALAVASRAASLYGSVCYFTVEPLPWLVACLISVSYAESAGDDRPASPAFANLGVLAGMARLSRLARSYFERGRLADDSRFRIQVAWADAVNSLTFCRWAEAEETVDQGVVLGRQTSDNYMLCTGMTIRAIQQTLTRPMGDALGSFGWVLETARERGYNEHEGWALNFSVPALVSLGRRDEAERRMREAEQISAHFDAFTKVTHEGMRALLYAELGRPDDAVEAARACMRAFKERPLTMYVYLGPFSAVCDVLLGALGRAVVSGSPDARGLAKEATRAVKNLSSCASMFHFMRPRMQMHRGTLAWHQGRASRAHKQWAAARASAEAFEMTWDQARIDLEVARVTGDTGSEAHARLDRARAAFAELGCVGDAAQVEAARSAAFAQAQ